MAACLRPEQGAGEHSGLDARLTNKKRLSSSGLGATPSPRCNLAGMRDQCDWSETGLVTHGGLDSEHFPLSEPVLSSADVPISW